MERRPQTVRMDQDSRRDPRLTQPISSANFRRRTLDLRPIFHYLDVRVRAHVFLCMLAAYIVWHLRQALAPLTYTDEHIPDRDDPVAAAHRSPQATSKDTTKKTPDGLTLHSFQGLLHHLGTLNRQTVNIAGQ